MVNIKREIYSHVREDNVPFIYLPNVQIETKPYSQVKELNRIETLFLIGILVRVSLLIPQLEAMSPLMFVKIFNIADDKNTLNNVTYVVCNHGVHASNIIP